MTIPEDDLERTQRLPVLTNLQTVYGRLLSDLRLEGAVVVHPDGHTEPLIGIYFHHWDDKLSLYDNLRAAFGAQYPGCKLVFGPL